MMPMREGTGAGGGICGSKEPWDSSGVEAVGRGGAPGRRGRGTHLGAQGPGGQHVSAEVEPLRLHLGVAGPAEVGDGLELGGALEDLHVVHQRLVALGDDGLVLWGGRPLRARPHTLTPTEAPLPSGPLLAPL